MMFGNKMNAVQKAVKKNQASTLIDLAGSKEPEVCLAAIGGLGTIGGQDASHFLVSCLQDKAPQVRTAVAEALGMIGDRHTKAFLASQMNKEEDPQVKEVMKQSMMKIKEY